MYKFFSTVEGGLWELLCHIIAFGHFLHLRHSLHDGDESDKRCIYVELLSVKIIYYLKLKKLLT